MKQESWFLVSKMSGLGLPGATSLTCTEVKKEVQRRKGTCPRSQGKNQGSLIASPALSPLEHWEISPRRESTFLESQHLEGPGRAGREVGKGLVRE